MYLRKSIFYGLCLVIAVLSLMPSGGVPRYTIENLDKVAHFGMYASLSFVMLKFFWNDKFDRKSVIYTCGFSISYGILLEILQNTSFSQREFDIFDIIANIIGALSGIALFKLLKK